jgi:hypothetical protein
MTDDKRARRIALLKRYREDFPTFAEQNLKIRDKDETIIPFRLNRAQRYVLEQFNKQEAATGKVRALVLKGRQQGISTLVEGLYYWKTSLNKNRAAYILSHEQPSADNLFAMVERYHRLNPIAPNTGSSNAKELSFDVLGSHYTVATAGTKAGGRGRTVSLFHGSEVALWPNAKDHFAASVQAVPDRPGTMVVLESTAHGASGEFYERWCDAVRGFDSFGNKVDYIPIFVPWFWDEGYVRQVDADFVLGAEPDDTGISEQDYATLYGLSNEQMAWRRAKIAELRDPAKFRQEYPATPSEAFVASSEDAFIKPHLVIRARKRQGVEGYGPLIIGADPAGSGGDRFAVAFRRGLKVERVEWRDKIDTVTAAQWLRSLAKDHRPERLYVDAGGIGHAVISMLRTWPETERVVSAVNFGGTSEHKRAKPKVPGPKNRRAEMWQRLKDWLELEEGVALPDLDALSADLTAPKIKPTMTNDLLLESKEEMKKRGVRSPDLADAIALTFASMLYVPAEKAPPPAPRPFVDDTKSHGLADTMRNTFRPGTHSGWMN